MMCEGEGIVGVSSMWIDVEEWKVTGEGHRRTEWKGE